METYTKEIRYSMGTGKSILLIHPTHQKEKEKKNLHTGEVLYTDGHESRGGK